MQSAGQVDTTFELAIVGGLFLAPITFGAPQWLTYSSTGTSINAGEGKTIYRIGMDVANGAVGELLCASFTLRVNECSEHPGFDSPALPAHVASRLAVRAWVMMDSYSYPT